MPVIQKGRYPLLTYRHPLGLCRIDKVHLLNGRLVWLVGWAFGRLQNGNNNNNDNDDQNDNDDTHDDDDNV